LKPYIRNAASNRQMQHIDKELARCHKELRTLLQTDENSPMAESPAPPTAEFPDRLKEEIQLYVRPEECAASFFKRYGQNAQAPYVEIYDQYAVLRFAGSGAGRYTYNGRLPSHTLKERLIWNIEGDPNTSVTLSGYRFRGTHVCVNGVFVPDPQDYRWCQFEKVFNKKPDPSAGTATQGGSAE
jgi:hypothetical protein